MQPVFTPSAPMIVPASDVRFVLTTAGSQEEAERLAHVLVDDGLAACVNLVPGVQSIYRWRGAAESADEVLLLIKTTAARLDAVEAALREAHSYEVPEFLVLTAESASQAYLAWLVAATASG